MSFCLKLRNDGNCFLSGVDLAVAEVGREPFATMKLEFRADNVFESEWNPRGEDGKLQNVEEDGALAPGMTARYVAEYATVPSMWEGEKEIEVFVTAVHATGLGALSTQAEDDSIGYIPDRRIRSSLSMGGGNLVVDYAGSYSTADVTVVGGAAPNSSGGNKDGSKDKSGPKGSSGSSGLPGTGDPLSLGALAAAVGAAGVAARRAYRSMKESGEAEE